MVLMARKRPTRPPEIKPNTRIVRFIIKKILFRQKWAIISLSGSYFRVILRRSGKIVLLDDSIYAMIFSFLALSTAWVRRRTSSFSKRLAEWVFIVFSE